MIRRIITIDEAKCNGCGLCADACHEGAIGIVGGKAKLLREDYCDGLGDCLPACPMNAISFEEREAPAYNEAAVLAAKKAKEAPQPCGCPGTACQSVQLHDKFHFGFGGYLVEGGLLCFQIVGNGLVRTHMGCARRSCGCGGSQAENHDHRQHQRKGADAKLVFHFLSSIFIFPGPGPVFPLYMEKK